MESATASPTDVASKLCELGISAPYASQIANGKRDPSLALAVKISKEAGLRLGLLAGATDEEVEVVTRLMDRRQ